jgi:hypothetical protein
VEQAAIHEDITLGAAIIEVDFVTFLVKNAKHFIGAEHGEYLLSFRMALLYNKKGKKSNLKLSVKQIRKRGRALLLFLLLIVPFVKDDFQCLKGSEMSAYIVIIHLEAHSFKQANIAAIGTEMANYITITPVETNLLAAAQFGGVFIGDVEPIQHTSQLVHAQLVNVGDLGVTYALSAPDAAQCIGEHFSGGVLMAAVATVNKRLVRDRQVADEDEVLKSGVHGVASFILMGFS